MDKNREKFGSRIGFILVSAGCAVGLGNVWKFPYLCGQNGGAIFVLIYLLCLALIACPILICELSVGRASQKSCAQSFRELQPSGGSWHLGSGICVAGNYLLMMFYTCVCGWMLSYFVKFLTGDFAGPGLTADQTGSQFSAMLDSPGLMTFSTLVTIVAAFLVCSFGVQKGVERVSKIIMSALLGLLCVLCVNSVMLPGAEKGIEFYLVPNFDAMMEIGIGTVLFNAMSQAFFTLSIGIGAMAIFGSYLDKKRSLTGEGVLITALDTVVALLAGFVIIPACFAFGIEPGAGPSLIFITMPNVFAQMPGGMIWGCLFFLFMSCAALSTIIAVFENIISSAMDIWGWSRKKTICINAVALFVLSMPCILGFNVLSGFHPLGGSSNILDLEDFLVSNNLLPLGALMYLIFCVHKTGWGWNNFIKEVDSGEGPNFPKKSKLFLQFVIPVVIVFIYLKGYYDMFSDRGSGLLVFWMTIAAIFLGFVGFISLYRRRASKIKASANDVVLAVNDSSQQHEHSES